MTYRLGIAETAERHRLILRAAHHHVSRGQRVLVLCQLVEHARALHRWYAGRTSASSWQLDGSPDCKARVPSTIEAFRRAERGGLLIATPFFREGINVPEIDAFVNAAAGKSEVDLAQALGRALRPRPDKAVVAVYDFSDGGAETRRPDKDYLEMWSLERVRIWRGLGYEVMGTVPGQ